MILFAVKLLHLINFCCICCIVFVYNNAINEFSNKIVIAAFAVFVLASLISYLLICYKVSKSYVFKDIIKVVAVICNITKKNTEYNYAYKKSIVANIDNYLEVKQHDDLLLRVRNHYSY